jgi:hypothetical protein
MTTVTEDVAQLLEDLGLGDYRADGSVGGTIYLTHLPDAPDECMAVARYGGATSDSRLPYDNVNVQVRVRGNTTDVRTGERTAQDVYDALHGLGPRPLASGAELLLAVANQGGPVYMGRDENRRHEWAVNINCEIRRITANRRS